MEQYNFLDFSVNSQKHALYKSGEKIEIGTTAFNILLLFLQKPEKVIKRDELFAQIWPGKIVTDATLYKQVQRLRKVLGDTAEDKTIITTIHGIGFEFLPEVTTTTVQTSNLQTNIKRKKTSKSKLIIFSALFLASYFVISQFISEDDSTEITIIPEVVAQPFTVAMIPNFSGIKDVKNEWMANGGVHYLAETFDRTKVNIKRFSRKYLKQTDPDKFALELNIKNKVDASVVFGVIERNKQFISDVKIRDVDGIIAEKKFSSITIKNLLDDISLWSKQVLKLESTTIKTTMSENRYAVENYIRGMSAQLSGDAKAAIKYFELATIEDADFWLAWYELTISYRKQGDNQKALAILNSLDKTTPNARHKVMLQTSKGNIYYRLGEYDTALVEINLGIALVKKLNDNRILSVLLTNKAFVLKDLGNSELAMNTIQESIDLINARAGDNSSSLGSAYNTLSGLYIKSHQYNQANKYSLLAIKNFKSAGDVRYEITAKSRYAAILHDTGSIKKSKKLNKELLIIRQSLQDIPGQTSSLLRLASSHMLLGEFKQTEKTIQQASDLLDITENKFQRFDFLIRKAQLMLLIENLPLTKDLIDQMDGQHYNDSNLFLFKTLQIQYHRLNNNDQQWRNTVLALKENVVFEGEPLNYLYQAQLAIKENNNQHAEFMFEKAKALAITQQQAITIGRVMNPYIAFLIENNKYQKADELVTELEKYKPLVYPYLKNKAQLAFLQEKYFSAITLMEQLKNTANDHWKVEDELLLEKYHEIYNTQKL